MLVTALRNALAHTVNKYTTYLSGKSLLRIMNLYLPFLLAPALWVCEQYQEEHCSDADIEEHMRGAQKPRDPSKDAAPPGSPTIFIVLLRSANTYHSSYHTIYKDCREKPRPRLCSKIECRANKYNDFNALREGAEKCRTL